MRIGDKVTFTPHFDKAPPQIPNRHKPPAVTVTGVIVGVHRAHHWYRVRYCLGGCVNYECFKFIPADNDKIKPLCLSRWGAESECKKNEDNRSYQP